jgi:hypothetical protein
MTNSMDRISKKDIVNAIAEINANPELRKGRASSTYDLIYDGIDYPPKLVISIAHRFATGKELKSNDFKGGIGTSAFKLLQKEGFEINVKKQGMNDQNVMEAESNEEFIKLIEAFIEQSKTSDLSWKSYKKSFRNLTVKVSFGKGVPARIPWVGLVKDPNSISKGIYPVFLFYKEFNKLILAYGISETKKSDYNWTNTEAHTSIKDWHLKEFDKTPDRYGSSYIKGVYDLDIGLNKDLIATDLDDIISEYEELDFEKESAANYWVFQGSPEVYNMSEALKSNSIKTWTVSSHRNRIKSGDKFILWLTGKEGGCFALGRVTSPVTIMQEEDLERSFYITSSRFSDKPGVAAHRVFVEIEHNYFNNPISKGEVKNNTSFKNFKGGSQGTNFSSTKEEYDAIIKLKEQNNKQYWIYAPGENADLWEDFYEAGIMGLGWNQLGDLNKYASKKEIKEKLQNLENTKSSKKNDASANFEFAREMKPRDIVIVKKGRSELLGYGEVSSDYYYDNQRDLFKSCRKVDWMAKGNWKVDHSLVLKTLTNITDYPLDNNFETYYNYLLSTMKGTNKSQAPLSFNQILYGPPGTGKTYKLQKEYFDQFTIKETALSRDQYVESLVADLTWWQAISIVVLDLGKAKVNDIYRHTIIRMKEKLSSSKNIKPTIWGQLQSHTMLDCPNVNVVDRSEPLFFNKSPDSIWSIDEGLLEQSYPEAFEILEKSKNFVPDNNKSIKNYEFITFHQSFSYEDFIEGIKPKLDETEKDVTFEIKDGVFKKLCLKAEGDPENNYAIFIDEINRGNVSAIFGELITLIENDKRIGEANEIKVRLPYSKSEFGVPSNLSIIGTMNTADRSVEALDTALRRRFSFEEIVPNPSLLAGIKFKEFSLTDVLHTINERIEVLLDRDHKIGHSYFLKLKSGDLEGLKSVFAENIVPLLQEYFYHDYEKIALILGEGFIRIKENRKVNFANFKTIETPEIVDQFELINPINDIEQSISLLLND